MGAAGADRADLADRVGLGAPRPARGAAVRPRRAETWHRPEGAAEHLCDAAAADAGGDDPAARWPAAGGRTEIEEGDDQHPVLPRCLGQHDGELRRRQPLRGRDGGDQRLRRKTRGRCVRADGFRRPLPALDPPDERSFRLQIRDAIPRADEHAQLVQRRHGDRDGAREVHRRDGRARGGRPHDRVVLRRGTAATSAAATTRASRRS